MTRLALLPALACALLLAACATPPREAAALGERDREEILAVLTASADGWNKGDLKGHLAIYDASVTTMTKTGPRPGVDAIERAFREAYFAGGKPKQMLSFSQVSIRPLSDGSALMTGRFLLAGGGLDPQSGWFTLVWVRTAAGWRVVHDHTG